MPSDPLFLIKGTKDYCAQESISKNDATERLPEEQSEQRNGADWPSGLNAVMFVVHRVSEEN